MNTPESLKHAKWECKYHIVCIPKYRRKSLYRDLRQYMGEMLKDLASQKECKILEGHLMSDHVHILISIPPKYDSTQIFSVAGSWIYQRQKCDIHSTNLCRTKKELHWTEILGKRVLCVYRR